MWEVNDAPKIIEKVFQNKIQRNGLSKKLPARLELKINFEEVSSH